MPKRASMQMLLGALVASAALAGLGVGCSARGHAVGSGGASSSSSSGNGGGAGTGAGGNTFVDDAGDDGPPALDASGFCGNQIHQVVTHPPNVYFLFDVSGSMASPGGSGYTRYQLVEHSAVELLQKLGPLINVGAAVFPKDATPASPCHVGGEVFPVSPGDPISPNTGPTTEGFIVATSLDPVGGTPTAATLTALQPSLVALPGVTIVLLATDGGPNCDAALSCGVDTCIPNLEGDCKPIGANCCAPGGETGPEGCLDHDAAVSAVAALAAAGIRVYVIGIPGSEIYASVLGDMAVAGGAPQPAAPFYYEVDDLGTLEQVFQSIASGFVSCAFTIEDPPPDEQHTNVYFDDDVVPADPKDGWIWESPTEIDLVGAACKKLKAGEVKQVQIVSGCPTKLPG